MVKKESSKVSIIINCFNGEEYLRNCLDSVLNQTFKNWEIIFWDNRSTDKSYEIVKSYKDKRIKYIDMSKVDFSNFNKDKIYKSNDLASHLKDKYHAEIFIKNILQNIKKQN